jgi:hypothetical protein
MKNLVFMTMFLLTVLFLKLIEMIFTAWNNKEYVTGLFGDLTKAFDSFSHEILILKLEFYGVNFVY